MAKTREETIRVMIQKATNLLKNWSRDEEDVIWTMCSDWNSKHENEEIFMCEYQSEESETVNGFMIEDDYWVFES